MKRASSLTPQSMWRLRLVAAILAAVGQVGFSSASLTLVRDESSALSHAERSGVELHHGHNEATCAACIALSSHATVNPAQPPIAVDQRSALVLASRPGNFLAGPQLLSNSCRAPPREV